MQGDWPWGLTSLSTSLPEPSRTPSEQEREGALLRWPHTRDLRSARKSSLPDTMGCSRLSSALCLHPSIRLPGIGAAPSPTCFQLEAHFPMSAHDCLVAERVEKVLNWELNLLSAGFSPLAFM